MPKRVSVQVENLLPNDRIIEPVEYEGQTVKTIAHGGSAPQYPGGSDTIFVNPVNDVTFELAAGQLVVVDRG